MMQPVASLAKATGTNYVLQHCYRPLIADASQ